MQLVWFIWFVLPGDLHLWEHSFHQLMLSMSSGIVAVSDVQLKLSVRQQRPGKVMIANACWARESNEWASVLNYLPHGFSTFWIHFLDVSMIRLTLDWNLCTILFGTHVWNRVNGTKRLSSLTVKHLAGSWRKDLQIAHPYIWFVLESM